MIRSFPPRPPYLNKVYHTVTARHEMLPLYDSTTARQCKHPNAADSAVRRGVGRFELAQKQLPGGGQTGLLLVDDADGALQLRREPACSEPLAAAAQHGLRQDRHAEPALDHVQDRVIVGHAVLHVDLRVAREQLADAAAAAPLLEEDERLGRQLIDLNENVLAQRVASGRTASMVSR